MTGTRSGGLVRKAGWGIADQALSSLTNFALSIAVARSVPSRDFGAFALGFATYLLVMGATRAVCAQPVSIRYAAADLQRWREGVARSTGAAVVISGVAALVCGVVAWSTSGPLSQVYLGLAVGLPGLMVQDCWRFAFFARDDGRAAFLNDLSWAVAMLPAIGVLMAMDVVTVLNATLIWSMSATAAALVGMWQARVVPTPRGTRSWLHEHRDIVPSYVGEFGATAGAKQAAPFGVSVVASLTVVAALRAAEIVMGPIRTLFDGIRQVAQPEAVRLFHRGGNLPLACAAVSGGLAVVALTVGAVLVQLPDRVGELLLRDTWHLAEEILLPTSIVVAGSGIIAGAQMGLHALVAVRRTLAARLLLTVMTVGGQVGGAWLAGAAGAAWGAATAYVVGAVAWWWSFRGAWAQAERPTAPARAAAAAGRVRGDV